MLNQQRKQWLLERLQIKGQLVAADVAQELGTSEDTIRRDLRELGKQGRVQRVHGGALPASPAVANVPARREIASQEKRVLAQAAAALITPRQVVFLDGGTTALALAQAMPARLVATVITHSPEVALALAAHEHIQIILLGGTLFRHSMVNMGGITLTQVQQIQADWFFMGATGVHAQAGLTTGDYEEAALKRAISSRAAETVVMASSEKIGAASSYQVIPLSGISRLLVTDTASGAALDSLAQTGVTIQRCNNNTD
jgi:DeoR/GlpR family transcriptional regulator of sugar metabolism